MIQGALLPSEFKPQTMAKYRVLSPDGFDIVRDKTYSSPEKAKEQLKIWVGRYETQGYYSTIVGDARVRIPVHELEHHCSVVPI